MIGDIFRDSGGHTDVLFNHQDINVALLAKLHQHVSHLRYNHRCQAFGRFIHDQQSRIQQQCPADGQHLLFTAGQLAAAIVLALCKPGEG